VGTQLNPFCRVRIQCKLKDKNISTFSPLCCEQKPLIRSFNVSIIFSKYQGWMHDYKYTFVEKNFSLGIRYAHLPAFSTVVSGE
jgi:hypothetical protein